MKTLLLLLAAAAVSFGSELPKPPVGVPKDARLHEGKWFKVFLEKLPYPRAVERCRTMGGALASVPDAATWTFIQSLTTASVWLGASDEKTEGVWLWQDGSPVTFSDWYAKQPDNSAGAEHFLSTYKGQWNDTPKNGEFMPKQFVVGFVCQWPAR